MEKLPLIALVSLFFTIKTITPVYLSAANSILVREVLWHVRILGKFIVCTLGSILQWVSYVSLRDEETTAHIIHLIQANDDNRICLHGKKNGF